MSKSTFIIDTLDKALNVVQSYGTPIASPVDIAGVRVGNVSRINGKTGMPFTWDKSGEPYAIVNFKAITIDKFNEVKAQLREIAKSVGPEEVSEQWSEAVRNCNLTHNANYALADKLEDAGKANLDIDYVKLQEEDMEGLRVVRATPIVRVKHNARNEDRDGLMDFIYAEAEATQEITE